MALRPYIEGGKKTFTSTAYIDTHTQQVDPESSCLRRRSRHRVVSSGDDQEFIERLSHFVFIYRPTANATNRSKQEPPDDSEGRGHNSPKKSFLDFITLFDLASYN